VSAGGAGLSPWQHKYKSTDSENAEPYGGLRKHDLPEKTRRLVETEDEARRRPLTAHDDVELREECLDDDGDVRTWDIATFAYMNWLQGYTEDGGALVFEDEDGDRTTVEPNVRFSPSGAKREYARLADLERGLRHEWGDALHTVMLSLTASSRNVRGGYRCPADHLNEHLQTWDAVREAVRRAVGDRECVVARVLEPHKSGFGHTHVAVFVRGTVRREDFHGCIDTHLRNCPSAERPAHEYDDCIDVRRVADESEKEAREWFDEDDGDDVIGNLSAYLSAYMAESFTEPDDRPNHVRRFNALLWATNTRRVSYSQNAYDFMETGRELREDEEDDDGDDGDLTLVGYAPDGDPEGAEVWDITPDHEKRDTTATTSGLALPWIVDPTDRSDLEGEPPPED
jgi:hypothetical protein